MEPEWKRTFSVAVAMGGHPRLGKLSDLSQVAGHPDLLHYIVAFALRPVPVVIQNQGGSRRISQTGHSTARRDFSCVEPRTPAGTSSIQLVVPERETDPREVVGRVEMPFASVLAVSGNLKMPTLCTDGGYFSLELSPALQEGEDEEPGEDAECRRRENGRLEIKFDGQELRCFGPTTCEDIRVLTAVEAGEWVRMEVRLDPRSQRVFIKVDGQSPQVIRLGGALFWDPWTHIRAIILKGVRPSAVCEYADFSIEAFAPSSDQLVPLPLELVLDSE